MNRQMGCYVDTVGQPKVKVCKDGEKANQKPMESILQEGVLLCIDEDI